MKKVLVFILIILLLFPLSVWALVRLTYSGMDSSSVPTPVLLVQEQEVSAQSYTWHTPILGGLSYKTFTSTSSEPILDLGEISDEFLNLVPPPGFTSTAVIAKDNVDVWSGSADHVSEFVLLESGQYSLEVRSARESVEGQGYGEFLFQLSFSAQVDIHLESSSERLAQGDVLAIQLYNVPEYAQAEGRSPFGSIQFVSDGAGRQVGYLAASHDTVAEEYAVSVQVGERTFNVPVQVQETPFTEQELTIDTDSTQVTEANSSEAYAEYNSTIPPLFLEADSARYWSGLFVEPAQGDLSTEYGLYRYTNGSTVPSRHAGIDIAAPRGTQVIAPNAGRVILATELLNTGNTVVIEHGNGLKSLFYHLDSLDVSLGDMVETGDKIGEIGSTGYSTGPHLHYEVRLFENTVDPMRLFDGSSGLYTFEDEETLVEEDE